ncbi:hypothetical protein B0H10DRAFT_2213057 [Mycena sp. CBHHK59/15]|nr:hypothetical protein B0H10DRAFT_2213057 [Mycena sp. CBHHK59/15]
MSAVRSRVPHDTSRDIILTPKDRRNKVLANKTHHAIQQQLNTFVTESRRLNQYSDMPLVRAVTKYRNGDIHLTFHSTWAASVLTEEAEHWLPVFSSFLQLRAPTFPIVMHRVSTDFEVGTGLPNDDDSERDNNIAELVRCQHNAELGFGESALDRPSIW